jgi:hypothetical protein
MTARRIKVTHAATESHGWTRLPSAAPEPEPLPAPRKPVVKIVRTPAPSPQTPLASVESSSPSGRRSGRPTRRSAKPGSVTLTRSEYEGYQHIIEAVTGSRTDKRKDTK